MVEERELPDCRGENPEQIAFLENDSELTDHLPADMAYHVLFDENCDGDTEYCDKVLQWLPELIRRLSRVGTGGEFTWVKGAGQEIESSRPDLVLAAVDEMFEKAIAQ
jgi:hypothetical protein